MKRVKDKPELVKTERGAVINTDTTAYLKAKAMKRKILDEVEKNKRLAEKVNTLEQQIQDILKRLDK